MKTTIDIPDDLFLRANATAALRGVSVQQWVSEIVTEKWESYQEKSLTQRLWMRSFGALSDLGPETRRIEALIEEECKR